MTDRWFYAARDVGLRGVEIEAWIAIFFHPAQLAEVPIWKEFGLSSRQAGEARWFLFGRNDPYRRDIFDIKYAICLWSVLHDEEEDRIWLDEADLAVWRSHGFGSEEANQWAVLECAVDDARSALQAGVDLPVAREWRRQGFPLAQIHAWRRQSIGPDRARRWCRVGVTPTTAARLEEMVVSPEAVAGAVGGAYTSSQLPELLQHAGSPATAVRWSQYYYRLSDVRGFLEVGFDPTEGFEWHQLSVSPSEARSLIELGISSAAAGRWPHSLRKVSEIRAWRDLGFEDAHAVAGAWQRASPAEVHLLMEHRFDFEEALKVLQELKANTAQPAPGRLTAWIEHFGPGERLPEWVRNFTPEEALTWRDHNFDPESARKWRGRLATPAQASEARALGVEPEDWWFW